ncbi:S-layer homology domain-containing protein, partial [Agathobaculum sp.]|uniref:S-layer homology domain-containing protein n=1 Tax=Agathobaculum sp. TaxID=2048138 RepID=UPI0027B9C62A
MYIDYNIETWDEKTTKAVEYVSAAGIMSGYVDGSFRLMESVTFREFAGIIHHTFSKYSYISFLPSEKSSTDWATPYIDFFKQHLPKNISQPKHLKNPNTKLMFSEANRYISYFYNQIILSDGTMKPVTDIKGTEDEDCIANRKQIANLLYYYSTKYYYQLLHIDLYGNNLYKKYFEFWAGSTINPFSFALDLSFYIPSLNSRESTQRIFYLFQIFKNVPAEQVENTYLKIIEIDSLITSLFTHNTFTSAYHYTSLSSLMKMLSKSNTATIYEQPKTYLHMTNAAFLNDPQEGTLFLDQVEKKLFKISSLKQFVKKKSSISNNVEIIEPNTYILCLTVDPEERLPLWIQYADQAAGCRIEFKIPPGMNFMQVKYLKASRRTPKAFDRLIDIAQLHHSYCIQKYIIDRIYELLYYYKDIYYKHENEIRFTQSLIPQKSLRLESNPSSNDYSYYNKFGQESRAASPAF